MAKVHIQYDGSDQILWVNNGYFIANFEDEFKLKEVDPEAMKTRTVIARLSLPVGLH